MNFLNVSNSYLTAQFKRLLPSEFNISIRNIKFIGGGSYGKVFKTELSDGRIIALKAFRIDGNQLKEASQVKILSGATSVKMPEILFTYGNGEIAFLGMTFIDGCNALNPLLLLKNKRVKSEFAENVINGMLQWHSVKGEKFGDIENPVYSSWYEFYKTEKLQPVLNGLIKLADEGKYSKKLLDFMLKATEIYEKVYAEPENPVLIHGDLNIMNIMVNPGNLMLNGFIDPTGSAWADREYDLFQLRNMWGDCYRLYETYKSKTELKDYSDFRVAYYAAINEASCRLNGAIHIPLWEIRCNNMLKKEMSKFE
ncbi:MAG: aminoglycoside phosphotransferase family protein [Ruminococcaceae bacterium]|nr:aminoglycoside phosphotransferase family protein [Oscillospiraceae bacterium]